VNTIDQNRLVSAYVRLSAEAKKIKESPANYGVRGEPKQHKCEPKKQNKEQPTEQLRMF
jgi:hypothetical protein